jgi:hypothetical protein
LKRNIANIGSKDPEKILHQHNLPDSKDLGVAVMEKSPAVAHDAAVVVTPLAVGLQHVGQQRLAVQPQLGHIHTSCLSFG